MNGIASPDIPAYVSYLIVLVLSLLVARSQVNRVLSDLPQRWGFLSTWSIFWAHTAIPVVLFWFLDYTNALRDTSLFAALIVAFGYRQIFVGGVDSIRLPGQTQRLWQPFELWVNRVVARITLRSKQHLDRFSERVKSYLAGDTARLQQLMITAFLYTTARASLEQALAALSAEQPPAGMSQAVFDPIQNRKRVGVLLDDLKVSTGSNYGYLLYRQRVIPGGRYLLWFGNARSQLIAWGVTITVGLLLAGGCYTAYRSATLKSTYYQWRFTKTNNSDYDRFRSSNYLAIYAQTDAQKALGPVIEKLRYKGCPVSMAESILRLVEDVHRPGLDPGLIPGLMDAMRTENYEVRLAVHTTLADIIRKDYPKQAEALKDELAWVPAKEDSPELVDLHLQAWLTWWAGRSEAPGRSPAANSST